MKEKESYAYFLYDKKSYKEMKQFLKKINTPEHYEVFTKISLIDGLGNSFKFSKLKGFYYSNEEMMPYEKLHTFFPDFKMVFIYRCEETKIITVYDKGKIVFDLLEQGETIVDNLNQLVNDKIKVEIY